MHLPDYRGGSIVNLMASIVTGLGGEERIYPPLRALDPRGLTSRNVVLLVIDGLGHDYLLERGAGGTLAQHLEARITSVFPSTTASAITTFLTGTAPQQHGLTGWFMHFRELGAVIAVLPFRPRHGGGPPAVSVQALLEHVPVFDRVPVSSYVVAPQEIAHSAFNTAHLGRAGLRPYATLDGMFQAIERVVRAPGDRRYAYAYWPELDRLAHEHGIASRETAAHLARLDAAFDEFLGAIAGTDTTVIVTADHGFVDAAADEAVELEAHPELARMLRLPLCGEPRAAYCYVDGARREAFADYVTAHLAARADVYDSEYLIESGWFGLGAPHPRLRERTGDFTLVMKSGATIKDGVPGEERHPKIGVHGGTSEREMYVPLIVARA